MNINDIDENLSLFEVAELLGDSFDLNKWFLGSYFIFFDLQRNMENAQFLYKYFDDLYNYDFRSRTYSDEKYFKTITIKDIKKAHSIYQLIK